MDKIPANQLKVLHVLSGDLWAGKECQVVLQLEALRKLGCDVSLLLFNPGETAQRAAAAGIPVCVAQETDGFNKLIREAKIQGAAIQPNIVCAHGHKELIVAIVIARTVGGRVISSFHGAPELHPGLAQLKVSLILGFRKLLSRLFASRLTAVSEALIRELNLPTAKTNVVYNVAAVPNSATASQNREKQIVVVGRLVGVKRVSLALDTFAELRKCDETLREYELLIIGEGPERGRLETQAQTLQIDHKVKFLGFRGDAPELISKAALLLITSLREGIPTVILEALYARTPFVSTPLPGVAETLSLLPTVPAIITKDSQPTNLATAIQTLLGQTITWPDSLDEKLSAHFSPAAVADHLRRIYREVLAS